MTISEKQPWECPRCHKINAHWLPQCFCLSNADKQANGFNQVTSSTPSHFSQGNRCSICNGFHGYDLKCAYLRTLI